MTSTCDAKISGMPDEAVNIYAAIKYLSKEAENDDLTDIQRILDRTALEIITVYCDNNHAVKGTEEMVDSLFLSFAVLVKYLTAGSEDAKTKFLNAISLMEKASLQAEEKRYA